MKNEFIELLQRRLASTSIGPSTARGMGPTGTIQAARDFLMELDLRAFKKRSRSSFQDILDESTEDFKRSLPKGSRHWGSSRKFLNIFLRGAFYNRYLCEQYDLYRLEPWLEIPLDSHVARGLGSEQNAGILPKWRTVIGLRPGENRVYQEFAEKVASSKGTFRIHLDLLYWRGDHMVNKAVERDRAI